MTKPTPQAIKDTRTAIEMLLCIKILPMVIEDLIISCEADGIFRHKVKYTIKQVTSVVQKSANLGHQIFIGIDPKLGHDFLKRSDDAIAKIDNSIAVQGVSRNVNIAIALLDLTSELLSNIGPTYGFRYAKDLERVKIRLKGLIVYEEYPFIKPLIAEVLRKLQIQVE